MSRLAWNYYRLPNLSSLVGPLIGAIAGLAGGAFAALASIRASQIAARAPLANTLFELAKAHVALGVSMVDKGDVSECRRYFLTIWNQLATQRNLMSEQQNRSPACTYEPDKPVRRCSSYVTGVRATSK